MSFVVIDLVYFQGIRFLAWTTYAFYGQSEAQRSRVWVFVYTDSAIKGE
jgi:hypothetical protein